MPSFFKTKKALPYRREFLRVQKPLKINSDIFAKRSQVLKKRYVPMRKYAEDNVPFYWYYNRSKLSKKVENPLQKRRDVIYNNIKPMFNIKSSKHVAKPGVRELKQPNNQVYKPLNNESFVHKYFFETLTNQNKKAFDFLFYKQSKLDQTHSDEFDQVSDSLFSQNKMAYDLALRRFFVKLHSLTGLALVILSRV
jgi:hypothetical protein